MISIIIFNSAWDSCNDKISYSYSDIHNYNIAITYCNNNITRFIAYTVPIRLAGGNFQTYGRVEIFFNGEWGTVCDDGWNYAEATVVCRQLGFYSSRSAYGSARYGQGTGPIWLSRLSCSGDESNLIDCSQLSVKTKNCTHSDDASVVCYGNRRK